MDAGTVIGNIIGYLIGLLIVSLVAGLVLKVAANWADGMDFDFGEAFITLFLYLLLALALQWSTAAALGDGAPKTLQLIASVESIPQFLMLSSMISLRHGVSFVRGAKISFVFTLIFIVIVFVIYGLVLWVRNATA